MPIPKPTKHYTCSRCGRTINPILHRYLWLCMGWRGHRPVPEQERPREQKELILCGPCGVSFREEVQKRGILLYCKQDGLERELEFRGIVRD